MPVLCTAVLTAAAVALGKKAMALAPDAAKGAADKVGELAAGMAASYWGPVKSLGGV